MWDLDTHLAARTLEREVRLRGHREPWMWPWRRGRALTFEYVEHPAARRWRRFAGPRGSVPPGPVVLATFDGAPLFAISLDGSTVVGPAGARDELVTALRPAASWLGRARGGR